MKQVSKFFAGVLSVALMLGLALPVLADEAKGTVRTVHGDKNDIVIKGIVNDTTYYLDKGAWVILDGRKSKLTDLREGDKAAITYEKRGENLVSFGVRAWRNASETHGTVRHVIADKNQLVLKGVVKDTTYFLDKDATVYLNQKISNFSDLRDGDDVHVTYEKRGDELHVSEIRAVRNK